MHRTLSFVQGLGGLVGLMNPELMLKSPGMWWAAAGAFFGLVRVHGHGRDRGLRGGRGEIDLSYHSKYMVRCQ